MPDAVGRGRRCPCSSGWTARPASGAVGRRGADRSPSSSRRSRRRMKSRSSRLTFTGSRAWGRWPDPSRTASDPFASSRAAHPIRHGRTCVVAAVDHQDRTVDPGQQRPHVRLVPEPRRQLGRDERRGVRLEPPADGVLVRLRRVRLGQALREEELEEVLVVLDPVVAVELPPAVVRLARLLERPARARTRFGRGQRHGRSDEGDPLDPLGMLGRQEQRPFGAPRQRDQDRALAWRSRPSPRAHPRRTPPPGTPRGRAGRSERPLPRPSNVITRHDRAR